jgi:GMP synthase (glutamine-hydrolysing)
MSTHPQKIVIVDFGSQTTQLIARRIREQKVYSEIHPYTLSLDRLAAMHPTGIVLSVSPASVYDDDAPISDPGIYSLGVPVLGICGCLGQGKAREELLAAGFAGLSRVLYRYPP